MNQEWCWISGYHALFAVLLHQAQQVREVFMEHTQEQTDRGSRVLGILRKQSIVCHLVSRSELEASCAQWGISRHSIVARCVPFSGYTASVLPSLIESEPSCVLLVLDEVQDPQNLGACLRSAGALGAQAVIAKKTNSCALTAAVFQASAGSAAWVPLVLVTNLVRQLEQLKKMGFWIVGFASEAENSLIDLNLLKEPRIALVFGNEGRGLRLLTRAHCDVCVRIPIAEHASSINVSVAVGIGLYETTRHRK